MAISFIANCVVFNRIFAEEFDDSYVWLDRQDCNWSAEIAMGTITDMITAHGLASQGGLIEGILCHDGGMLMGVISALEAMGLEPGADVEIVAAGSNTAVRDALESGWLTATSTQDPMEEASIAVQLIYDLIAGNPVTPGWTRTPTPAAYKETIDDFNWF